MQGPVIYPAQLMGEEPRFVCAAKPVNFLIFALLPDISTQKIQVYQQLFSMLITYSKSEVLWTLGIRTFDLTPRHSLWQVVAACIRLDFLDGAFQQTMLFLPTAGLHGAHVEQRHENGRAG